LRRRSSDRHYCESDRRSVVKAQLVTTIEDNLTERGYMLKS
jgi:hypothetical protein